MKVSCSDSDHVGSSHCQIRLDRSAHLPRHVRKLAVPLRASVVPRGTPDTTRATKGLKQQSCLYIMRTISHVRRKLNRIVRPMEFMIAISYVLELTTC